MVEQDFSKNLLQVQELLLVLEPAINKVIPLNEDSPSIDEIKIPSVDFPLTRYDKWLMARMLHRVQLCIDSLTSLNEFYIPLLTS